MEAGKQVVDNPVNLADFGAALTSADSEQMQAVLECRDVSVCKYMFICVCVSVQACTYVCACVCVNELLVQLFSSWPVNSTSLAYYIDSSCTFFIFYATHTKNNNK